MVAAPEIDTPSLRVVIAVAVLAPLLTQIPIGLRTPTVVLEIVLGNCVGPHGLNRVEPSRLVASLAEPGLTLLFIMAGRELKLEAILGPPIRLAVSGAVATRVLVALAVSVPEAMGMVRAPLRVGVALTTAAIGTLLPTLCDSAELETPFGRYVLAAGPLCEFGPIPVVWSGS